MSYIRKSNACDCGRPKDRKAEACDRCKEWDARRFGTGVKKEGIRHRPETFIGVRRALTNYLKEKGLEPMNTIEENNLPHREWITVQEAIAWSGIGRSMIYGLIADGSIKSTSLRREGKSYGLRRINFQSLRDYLNKNATGGE